MVLAVRRQQICDRHDDEGGEEELLVVVVVGVCVRATVWAGVAEDLVDLAVAFDVDHAAPVDALRAQRQRLRSPPPSHPTLRTLQP